MSDLLSTIGILSIGAALCLVTGFSAGVAVAPRATGRAGSKSSGTAADVPMPAIAVCIDVADLRERVRKLERIAAGVDL